MNNNPNHPAATVYRWEADEWLNHKKASPVVRINQGES